jgi:glycosyltransferase involved in cell wall biosynthesis
MSKPVCLVTAPVATRSGYGAHSRDIVRALIKLDKFDVKIWNVRWGNTPMNALSADEPNDKMIIDRLLPTPNLPSQPEIHVHIVIPNEFQAFGKYNIGITAGLETTACPAVWIEGLNRMNMNIVPSTFVKDVVEKTVFDVQDEKTKQVKGQLKSNKPIEVLFEGSDTDIYKQTSEFSPLLVEEMKKVEDPFNFLFVGHWLQGNLGKDRKDVGMLLKVFFETFKNQKKKPGLIMKTSGAGFSVIDRESILSKINSVRQTIKGELPNVYFMHGDFTDEQMNELYNHPKVKAHINLTHGEGFGRPLLEASMSQKPVIASDWSGHKDFLPKDLAVLVPGSLTDVPKESFPKDMHIPGTQWFTCNYQQTSRIMKDVFENYRNYKLNAKKLTIGNKSKFSLDEMTKQLGILLDQYIPEFPKEVKLELPKLKKVGAKGDTGDTKQPTPEMKLPKLKRV